MSASGWRGKLSGWWSRGDRTEVSDEPSAHEFLWALMARLDAQGVAASPQDGTFAVRLSDGRTLQLQEAWRSYARSEGTEARELAVERAVLDWRAAGRFATLADTTTALMDAVGQPATADPEHGWVELLDGTELDAGPVHDAVLGGTDLREAVACAVSDLAALPDQPAIPIVFTDAERGRAALLALLCGGPPPPPVAMLGAGLAARVGRVRGVARRWVAADEETLPDVLSAGLATLAEQGHRFVKGPTGGLMSGFGDARDAGVLLMPDEGTAQLGLRGAPVVWPVEPSKVWLLGRDDLDGLVSLCDHLVSRLPVLRPLSLVPLVRDGSVRWQPLQVGPEHALHGVLVGLAAEQASRQAAWLHPLVTRAAAALDLPAPASVRVEPIDGVGRLVADWRGPALIPAALFALRDAGRWVPMSGLQPTRGHDWGARYLEVRTLGE